MGRRNLQGHSQSIHQNGTGHCELLPVKASWTESELNGNLAADPIVAEVYVLSV